MENEILEVADDMADLLAQHRKTFIFGVLAANVAGLVTGVFLGYKAAVRSLESKYEERSNEEIAQAKAFYSTLNKRGDLSTPEKAVETLHKSENLEKAAEALTRYQGDVEEEQNDSDLEPPDFVVGGPDRVVVETTNVFERSTTEFVWNHEEEVKQRTSTEPYVVHEDEWADSLPGYTRVTLTYYEGDDTLADEKDEPIPTIDDVVGTENLLRFGHGTDDARTVFIRNERLNIDFEVLKHEGKFAHEVLGFQHGEMLASRDHRSSTRRFRSADE